jgi:hypothetical protein
MARGGAETAAAARRRLATVVAVVLAVIGVAVAGQLAQRNSPPVIQAHQLYGGHVLLASDQGPIAHILLANPDRVIVYGLPYSANCLVVTMEREPNGRFDESGHFGNCIESVVYFASVATPINTALTWLGELVDGGNSPRRPGTRIHTPAP